MAETPGRETTDLLGGGWYFAKPHDSTEVIGETVRIYFGVGAPNYTSGFHVIGEIFDTAYQLGSVTSPPITIVQSIIVLPGSANIVEFKCEVPGRYVLVDHALSRAERGLAGYLIVEGHENLEIFNAPRSDNDSGH